MDAGMHLLRRQAAQNGSNRGQGSNSLSGIISTLVPVIILAAISLTIFLILRRRYTKVYEPRSSDLILWDEKRRTPLNNRGFFGAIFDFKGLPDHHVLERNSLDGYLFLRFFKMLIFISLAGCLITWPILFPVNATGGGGQQQLDMLSFSNVLNVNRYYAHCLVAWIFLGLVTAVVIRERMYFVGLRQAYFLNSVRATRLTSRTVLFMSIPKESQSVEALRAALGRHVRNVWLATDCKDLEEMVEDRTKAALKLEGAEVKLTKLANKNRLKSEKKNPGSQSERRDPAHWIDSKKRPTHKLKPLIGKKVDTISWAQEELPKMNTKIASEQRAHTSGAAQAVSAAFVEFTSQAAAQRAFQLAAKSVKKSMEPRYIDVQPDEIIWKNLKTTYAMRKTKMLVATAIVTLIIIFWTPIIAFVASLTNINYLTNRVPFLSFINQVPSVILGVITGLLPTIVLAVCILLVPIICRLLAKLAGEPTLSAVELKTQTWYFAFQVIQVFLMTTFLSGAAAVTTQIINDPTSAPTLLAENLPKASNFYISYFILYGLAQAAAQILNVVVLILFVLLGKFLDNTPRKMYNRWVSLAGLGWGSEYPKWTNLGVIAISYSCIAPLVLGFSTIGFTFLYLAFRWKWLYVLGNKVDMKGEAYAKALKQLMWGVYLSSLCLIGLFAIGASKSAAGTGPLVLMIIFLVVVVVVQFIFGRAISPLEEGLPLDLVSDDAYDYDVSEEKFGANGAHPAQVRDQRQESNVTGTTAGGVDVEAHKDKLPEGNTGNKLTARIRPYIDSHFYAPNKNIKFELPIIDYEYHDAYYNPAIAADEPFIWLAKDSCGVSSMLVQQNTSHGVRSSDENAWFDEKNKLHWNPEHVRKVRTMLNEKTTTTAAQGSGAQARGDEIRG
ncbi:phosphate metabolism protein 7 [Lithohypha guttulata]|uniref:phosphate metabolism protein 7 n=1 Tax=Lithohypha guttulata TaxID=1690604 RepID=UPI002DE0B5C0|nr:phosphate metabolism protein 7 [Lithohypha guttulata]KAK5105155.1 phosphate metabolism protein 7 [Lithohypha guttulata]